MTKIIIKGNTEFTGICEVCGCKFSYELEDLNVLGSTVQCPCCHRYVTHPKQRPFDLKMFADKFGKEEYDNETKYQKRD